MDHPEDICTREAIKHCYRYIADNLDYEEIIEKLYTENVISLADKQTLSVLQLGLIHKNEKLLDILLQDVYKSRLFLKSLQTFHQNHVYDYILSVKEKYSSGELQMSFLTEIQAHLKGNYRKQKCNIIEKFPGEKGLILDLNEENLVMPLEVKVEVVDKDFLKQQKGQMPENALQYQYKQVDVKVIDEVFSLEKIEDPCRKSEFPSRLYLAMGIAGTGKTVTQKRFAWQFTSGSNPHLESFKLIFALPLRNINANGKLMDILCDEQYITLEMKQNLHHYLSQSPVASKVMFALDGVDEIDIARDSELYSLITGQLYPRAKVFITARPDAEFLRENQLKPDVRINIVGTNKDGIHNHIKASLIKSNGKSPDEKDVEKLIQKCQKRMFHYELLLIPLYLTLLTVVFNEHWVQFASFAQFRIPQTLAELFNQFAIILIKRWAQRKRIPIQQHIKFSKLPLESGSNIPIEIKRIFCEIGKMSFEFLMQRKYDFSQNDIEDYLLCETDLSDSGMFCIGDNGKYFFKHKSLQEYMASCYLSHMKCKDSKFLQHIRRTVQMSDNTRITNSKTTFPQQKKRKLSLMISDDGSNDHTLSELFSPLGLTMKMLVGMAPICVKEIISSLTSATKLKCKSEIYGTTVIMDVIYESELFNESGDPDFQKTMEKYVCERETVQRECNVHEQISHTSSVWRMISQFDSNTCAQVLKIQYNITLMYSEMHNTYVLCNDNGDEMLDSTTIPWMGVTEFFLLSKFIFAKTRLLKIERSRIMDLKLFKAVFPNLRTVDLDGRQYDDIVLPKAGDSSDRDFSTESRGMARVDENKDTKLKHITLRSGGPHDLPMSCVLTLFQEAQVQSLALYSVNIFHNWPCVQLSPPHWDRLQDLSIAMEGISSQKTKLCEILSNTPGLHKLILHELVGIKLNNCDCRDIMKVIHEHLHQLKQLEMGNLFNSESLQVFCDSVKGLSKVNTIGIEQYDLLQSVSYVVDTLREAQHICQIRIWYRWVSVKDEVKQMLEKLKQGRNVDIKYVGYDGDDGHILQEWE